MTTRESLLPSHSDPHAEYTQRLASVSARATLLDRANRQVSNLRLLVFLAGVGLWGFLLRPGTLSMWWLLFPVALFVALVLYHETVRRQIQLTKRSIRFYERGLARIEDRWEGTGTPGDEFLHPEHPYAPDLDLFGKGSLFELLCTARTHSGEQTLAAWLCAPATPAEIQARHEAITELRSRLDSRERVALLGEDVRAGVHGEALKTWAETPPLPGLPLVRILAVGLAILNVAVLIRSGFEMNAGVLALLLLNIPFSVWTRARVERAVAGVDWALHDLALLGQILSCIEQEPFLSPRLVALRTALETAGTPPSQQLKQLQRLVALLESMKNQMFVLIGMIVLWDRHVAFAIESWRAQSGPAVARWLSALGEFEAFCALAGYAYEHPADPFPDITTQGPCFVAEAVGHPLIPQAHCVRNDVTLGEEPRVLIISGSNMSGKSTLLRTVGTNIVLALAGAPVRAHKLRLSPLAIGATLRIQDSLQRGSSRFYAEITRIRQLMDLTKGPLPLFFLLDEILHGTNSHDRQVGAEAIVRSLVDRGAIGFVTTHDLALAHVAETLSPRAANVCFEDQLADGKLVFDYRMRPGIVRKSNALALMRAVGLEV
ncbi:MAG: DNA mismatch repair protein MutS [Deltaproteobacteria bacterium]|nr:DNA mismatch repair protein MutS [Deltaproteobacteria bacterium]